jgi:histidinol-phosphatase (PHP family)
MTFPHAVFYPVINELEIPIQVNSDCHYPNHVDAGFRQTYMELKQSGFKTMRQLFDKQWLDVEFDENGLK